MDFSPAHEALRSQVRTFAEGEVGPRTTALDQKGEFPRDLIGPMAKQGFLGVFVPKDQGGAGLGFLARAIMLEELARVYPPLAFFFEGNDNGLYLLLTVGNPEQKKRYLAALCRGDRLSCFALTEAGGGSAPGGMETTAEAVAGGWAISGRKVFITLAGMADLCCVVAKCGESFNAYLVEQGMPGFKAGKRENLAGMRSLPVGELLFEKCRVPQENMLGAPGQGLTAALTGLTLVGRPGVAAIGLGLGQGVYEAALRFAKGRKTGGTRLADLQGIQFALVDMEVALAAARSLVYRAAWLTDQGKSSREIGADCSRAKLFATETAAHIAQRAVQLMGGSGITEESGVMQRLNDALALFPAAGTSEIHRIIIGREITR